LDTKLNAERTGRKAAEGIGKDPQWYEGSDEKNEDAGRQVLPTTAIDKMKRNIHDSETTAYALADQACNNSASTYIHEL
jgi:hypothetical protein